MLKKVSKTQQKYDGIAILMLLVIFTNVSPTKAPNHDIRPVLAGATPGYCQLNIVELGRKWDYRYCACENFFLWSPRGDVGGGGIDGLAGRVTLICVKFCYSTFNGFCVEMGYVSKS